MFIVSNDVVPDMGMTVSAPGLRCRGLADGLRFHGYDVTEIVPMGPVNGRWAGSVPPNRPPGSVVSWLTRTWPDTCVSGRRRVVIAINSNQISRIPERADLAVVLDLFAPRILEVACQSPDYPLEEISALRRRDIQAIARADSFIVNGARKLGFYHAWLLQVGRDPLVEKLDVVPMPMAQNFHAPAEPGERVAEATVQAVSAGYLQGWSRPGRWYGVVAEMVARHNAEFHVAVVPRNRSGDGLDDQADGLEYFEDPAVTTHRGMLFDDYSRFMRTKSLAIDLFSNSLERPYAMVTRTVGGTGFRTAGHPRSLD